MRQYYGRTRQWTAIVVGSLCCFIGIGEARAAEPAANPIALPAAMSRDQAVRWALANNPELAAIRQQHGIAAAGVVIAEAYPFNPIWEAKVRPVNGPDSAGITNRVSNEHKLLIDVEIRHQGRYRRQGAYAALSRTEWEIAFQEVMLAVRAIRAFDTVVYRQQKLKLIEETIRLNEQTVKQVTDLREKLSPADLILAPTEVIDARAQLSAGRIALTIAISELLKALGAVHETLDLKGSLMLPRLEGETTALIHAAFEHRADLHARQMAVTEADARYHLAVADRFGNPNVGPAYEYDPARVNLIGAQFTVPIPVFNRHCGEIQQRQAELAKAALELRHTEMLIQQDVHAALDRLHLARAAAKAYETEIVPGLESGLKQMEDLFSRVAVDVLRVIDVRRKVLKARDSHVDALYEVRQALADLAAAVGDPSLATAQ